MSAPFFRDVGMPGHHQDRLAHERFLLDTYAERRAEERGSARAAAWLRGVMTRAGLLQ